MVVREEGRAPLLRTSITSNSRSQDFDDDKRRGEGSRPPLPLAPNVVASMMAREKGRLRWW